MNSTKASFDEKPWSVLIILSIFDHKAIALRRNIRLIVKYLGKRSSSRLATSAQQ